MEHGDVWRALDRLAARKGLTPSGLAKLAGLDATAFNKSKRVSKDGRERWPSTESISRVLVSIGAEYTEFAALVSGDFGHTLPALALTEAEQKDRFDENGRPDLSNWTQVKFPGADVSADQFVLEITDALFEPIYRPGDKLVVSLAAKVQKGDRVVVRNKNGELLVGVLNHQTEQEVGIEPLARDQTRQIISASGLSWIARIMWVSQ